MVDAIDRHGREAVPGEVVGEVELDRDRAVGAGSQVGLVQCDRGEVAAHVDRRLVGLGGATGGVDVGDGRVFCRFLVDGCSGGRRRSFEDLAGAVRGIVAAGRRVARGEQVVGAAQDDRLPGVGGEHVARHVGVERLDRVADLVPGERQHRLVDGQHRHVGTRDGCAVGVGHRDRHGRAGAGFQVREGGCCFDRERARARRDRQLDGARRVRRPRRGALDGCAVVVDPRCRAGHVDLHGHVRDQLVLDGDLEHGRAVGRLERRRRDDVVAQHGVVPARRSERRLHEQFGGVARRVLLGVGDDRHVVAVDVAGRYGGGAADPAGELGAVAAAVVVDGGGGHAVLARDVRRHRARRRCSGRHGGVARGGLDDLLGPLVVLEARFEPADLDREVPRHGVAVDVGEDRLDRQRVALLDEGAVAADADVAPGRVDEHVGRRGPRLAVDVEDRGGGLHVRRLVFVGVVELHLEEV